MQPYYLSSNNHCQFNNFLRICPLQKFRAEIFEMSLTIKKKIRNKWKKPADSNFFNMAVNFFI